MGSEFEQFRDQLDELSQQLEGVHRRLARLEAREAGSRAVDRHAAAVGRVRHEPARSPEGAADPPLSSATVAWIGRTLMVLGGAYLFRALSDRELVPPLLGAGAALAYAMLWLALGDRAAARGQQTSATFHGIAAVSIAYPLLWETTVVFVLLPPPATAAAMVAVLGLGLIVARRGDLPALAWAVAIAHLATAFALILGTHAFLPLSLAVFAAAATVETPPIRETWPRMRWPVALGADAAMVTLILASVRRASRASEPADLPGAGELAALLVLPLVYLASLGERAVRRQRTISVVGLVQLAVVLAVAIGGGTWVQRAAGRPAAPVASLALLIGAACYAAAFLWVDRSRGPAANFYACSTFAGVLTLVGSALLLDSQVGVLVLAWCALAMALLGLGVRFDRITLRFHGAGFALAAALVSGLVAAAREALLVDPASWRPLTVTMLFVLAVVLGGCIALIVTSRGQTQAALRLPQAALAALLVGVSAGLVTRAVAPLALGWVAEDAAPAALAALRSVAIGPLAVALAVVGRRWALPELHWLVYPVLGLGGAKLVCEDLRIGEPVALFAAFAIYGGSLLLTPRIMRRPLPAKPIPVSGASGR